MPQSESTAVVKKLRLVRRKPNLTTGQRHVSSASDGIVDVAAQVESGLIEKLGILELLPPALYERARGLLKNNELVPISAKHTPAHELSTRRIRQQAEAALRLIGRLYWEANNSRIGALSVKPVVYWLQQQLSDPASRLNKELAASGYDDLVELKRSDRWWGDVIGVRSKSAE